MFARHLYAAARQLYATVPAATRLKIAYRNLLAYTAGDVGQSIGQMLLAFGLDAPKLPSGRLNRTSTFVQELGAKVFGATISVTRNEDLANEAIGRKLKDFMASRTKVISDLEGKRFEDMFGYFITAFYREAMNVMRSRGTQQRREFSYDAPAFDENKPSEHVMEQMVQRQLERSRNVSWESDPVWRKTVDQIRQEVAKLDSRAVEPRRGRPSKYRFPHLRLFELMFEQGLSADKAADVLVQEEAQFQGEDPRQMRDALNRAKRMLGDVARTITDNLRRQGQLDDFLEMIHT